jgi:hypothetical protein
MDLASIENQADHNKRRISASSQTNYSSQEKILYSKPLDKYQKLPISNIKHNSIKLPDSKPNETHNASKFYKYNTRIFNLVDHNKNSYRKSKNLTEEMFDALVRINYSLGISIDKKNSLKQNLYCPYNKKKASKCAESEELFGSQNSKTPRKAKNLYMMHKTFYDIYPELVARATKATKKAK